MSKKSKSFSEQIVAAVEGAEVSRYRISAETGIHQSTLAKFVHGGGWIGRAWMDRMAEYLGLEIVVNPAAASDLKRRPPMKQRRRRNK